MDANEKLSPIETAKLENLEIVIEDGLQSFLDVGRALLQIRDERLYRLTHSTFESYCEAKWGISPRHANRLATAATITDGLGPIGPIVPTAESQVRPLAKLPVEERGAAWKEAVEASNGKPTAAAVEKIVERRKAPQASKVVEEIVVEDDNELANEVAAMLNSSVAAINKAKPATSKAVEGKAKSKRRSWKDAPHGYCPQSERGHEWSDDHDCELCHEPWPETADERLLCNMNDPRVSFIERIDGLRVVLSRPSLDLEFYAELRRRFLDDLEQEVDQLIRDFLPFAEMMHVKDDRHDLASAALRLLCFEIDAMNCKGASE